MQKTLENQPLGADNRTSGSGAVNTEAALTELPVSRGDKAMADSASHTPTDPSKHDRKLLAEWFWTDRWTGSSAFSLSLEARGLYREMLTQAWRRGGRLPNDDVAIQRLVGATRSEWRRCWPIVRRYWRVSHDSLVNDTQLEIWTKALTAQQRASDRGKKGAAKRHAGSTQGHAQASTQAQPTQHPSRAQAQRKHKPPVSGLSSSEERSLQNYGPADAVGERDADLADPVKSGEISGFLRRFCELYTLYRFKAKYFVKRTQHVPIVRQLLGVYTPQRLEKLAVVLLTTDDEWISHTDRGLNILSVKAAWLDGLLAEYESKNGEIQVAS